MSLVTGSQESISITSAVGSDSIVIKVPLTCPGCETQLTGTYTDKRKRGETCPECGHQFEVWPDFMIALSLSLGHFRSQYHRDPTAEDIEAFAKAIRKDLESS